jgi:hypothetical protein
MDRVLLDTHGGDLAKLIVPPCEFLLDYEDGKDADEAPATRAAAASSRGGTAGRTTSANRSPGPAAGVNKQQVGQEALAGAGKRQGLTKTAFSN